MEAALVALIVVALIALLIFSRFSPALLFTLAMAGCVLIGVIDIPALMTKATNEGLVTLLLLLMVSIGFERLPWLLALSNRAVRESWPGTLLSLSGMTMLFSAFVNNTAVVATLAGTLRKNPHHAASQILLPISYAAILGGTLTLIGTSTNLIVSSFLEDVTGTGIAFFAFLPVALPAALAGLVAMLLMYKVLPTGSHGTLSVNEFLIEMAVADDSRLIGKTVAENGLRDLGELFLVELVRAGRLITPVSPGEQLEAGDRLIFSGDVSSVGILERFHGLRSFAIDEGLLGTNLTEVVLLPGAAVIGSTIKGSEFRSRFDAAVVGLRREGSPVHRHEEGDAGELEAERLGRRDASDGGEDDVRPAAKDAGQAHVRRDEEAGHDEAVHGRAPTDAPNVTALASGDEHKHGRLSRTNAARARHARAELRQENVHVY